MKRKDAQDSGCLEIEQTIKQGRFKKQIIMGNHFSITKETSDGKVMKLSPVFRKNRLRFIQYLDLSISTCIQAVLLNNPIFALAPGGHNPVEVGLLNKLIQISIIKYSIHRINLIL